MTELPATSPLPGYLIDRYRSWHGRHFADNRAWYARLAWTWRKAKKATTNTSRATKPARTIAIAHGRVSMSAMAYWLTSIS